LEYRNLDVCNEHFSSSNFHNFDRKNKPFYILSNSWPNEKYDFWTENKMAVTAVMDIDKVILQTDRAIYTIFDSKVGPTT